MTDIPANFEAKTWSPTGEIVLAYRKANPYHLWPVQVWRCLETGELDYRSLPTVELPPLPEEEKKGAYYTSRTQPGSMLI